MNQYKDIIQLSHPTSTRHPRMSAHDRAAQFSPFASLPGYGAAIEETARLTEEKLDLGEETLAVLDRQHQVLLAHIREMPEITVTYFLADEAKSGGQYLTITGKAKRLDLDNRLLVLAEGTRIPMEDILALEGPLFRSISSPED